MKKNCEFVKLFADGWPIEVTDGMRSDWRIATEPTDIVSSAARRQAMMAQYRRYVWQPRLEDRAVVLACSPGEAGLVSVHSAFVSWVDTTWQEHKVLAPKGPPHKHAEVIKAWVDGAMLRWRYSFSNESNWIYQADGGVPSFLRDYDYEVSPQIIRYRRVLMTETGRQSYIEVVMESSDRTPEQWAESHSQRGWASHWIDTTWQIAEVPKAD